MKAKKSKKIVLIISISALLLLTSAISTYIFVSRETIAEEMNIVTFEFNAQEAPGWFAGANIYPDASIDTPQATVSRIVAQGTAEKPEGNCFVQFSYWADDAKDLTKALKDDENYNGTEFVLLPKGVIDSAMSVSSQDVKYQLHQYELVGLPNQQMSRGQQIAYFKAKSGYIQIRGYCLTADELSITAPVFSAISLKK